MSATLLMFDVGFGEMLLVVVLAIMLYGGDLPDVARKTGQQIRRFRGVAEDLKRQVQLPPEADLRPILREADPRPELRALDPRPELRKLDAPAADVPPPDPQGASPPPSAPAASEPPAAPPEPPAPPPPAAA